MSNRPRRAPVLLLSVLASSIAGFPSEASAQTTPNDQLFVVGSNIPLKGTGNETISATFSPSSFGCSGSQQFFVRSVGVTNTVTSGTPSASYFYLILQVPQPRQGGSPTSSSLVFSAAPQFNGTALFGVSSVGAPVTSLQLNKSGYAGEASIFFWGYCASPTTLGAVVWKT